MGGVGRSSRAAITSFLERRSGETPTSRWARGATKIAVGIATITATAKEVSQAGSRSDPNPSRTVVFTSGIVNDIATAVIAGASR
jgi:hypothetical protein